MYIKTFILVSILGLVLNVAEQEQKMYTVASVDGTIECTINAGANLTWAVTSQVQTIIAPSAISMRLLNGDVLGKTCVLYRPKTQWLTPGYQP